MDALAEKDFYYSKLRNVELLCQIEDLRNEHPVRHTAESNHLLQDRFLQNRSLQLLTTAICNYYSVTVGPASALVFVPVLIRRQHSLLWWQAVDFPLAHTAVLLHRSYCYSLTDLSHFSMGTMSLACLLARLSRKVIQPTEHESFAILVHSTASSLHQW